MSYARYNGAEILKWYVAAGFERDGVWHMSGQVNLDQLLRGLTCYRNVARVKVDVIACMSQVRTINHSAGVLLYSKSMKRVCNYDGELVTGPNLDTKSEKAYP